MAYKNGYRRHRLLGRYSAEESGQKEEEVYMANYSNDKKSTLCIGSTGR